MTQHGSETRKASEKIRLEPDVADYLRGESARLGIPVGEVVRSLIPKPAEQAKACGYCGEVEHDAACPLWKGAE